MSQGVSWLHESLYVNTHAMPRVLRWREGQVYADQQVAAPFTVHANTPSACLLRPNLQPPAADFTIG